MAETKSQLGKEDYKFFYEILKMYAEKYGEFTVIDDLPEMLIDPRVTIAQALTQTREKFDFEGYVIFSLAVQIAYLDEQDRVVSYWNEWDGKNTLGKIVSRDGDMYEVMYTPDRTILIHKDDIIEWDKEALLCAIDMWNYEYWQEELEK